MLSEPIPAAIGYLKDGDENLVFHPILILAVLPPRDVIYVDPQGRMLFSSGDYIVTDWRYNAETKEWFDINAPQAETEDEDGDSGTSPTAD